MNILHNTLMKSALLASVIVLTACGGGSSSSANYCHQPSTSNAAIINMASPSFGDYDLAIIDLNQTVPMLIECGYSGQGADYSLAAFGEHFYRIGRYGIDSVSKYSITKPQSPIYNYSTLASPDDPSSNPQNLIFVNENKAYLIQNEFNAVWIVDPSASGQSTFKIGEIDLSHYLDALDKLTNPDGSKKGDGKIEIANGIIVDGKLYVTLQRLNNWMTGEMPSYIAVIDTSSDEEIDTNPSDSPENLKGIELKTYTPDNLVYQAGLGILVQSSGDHNCFSCSPKKANGGIELISTTDYSTTILFNDSAAIGYSQIAVASANKAYIVRYNGWENTDLLSFNPSDTTEAMQLIQNLEGMDLRFITVNNGTLWVSKADYFEPEVIRINTADDSIIDRFKTKFLPEKIVFARVND